MPAALDGVLVVDKPVGPTSHDVVARMRRILGERRIGHTGTLDPSATGVLPLVIGRATRLARFLSGSDKEYEAVVSLGTATTTYDAEGEAVGPNQSGPLPARRTIEAALAAFVGTFDQQPPAYSAKKIGGVRSYTLARAAESRRASEAVATRASAEFPAPAAVAVTLHEAELLAFDANRITIRLRCSAGFYVRSLAHELGVRLGTGAHLSALRRTRSGEHAVGEALPLDTAERDPAAARLAVVPLDRLLTSWTAVVLTEAGARRAARGCELGPGDLLEPERVAAAPRVRLLDLRGRLLGIGEASDRPGLLHPALVFM